MKRLFFIITFFVLCSFAAIVMGAEPGSRAVIGPYNPTISYPGEYTADMLYFRNRPTDPVWHNVLILSRISRVTCADALAHLQREGKWQGHLQPDGSCGSTAEPADWVLGNRLNYDAALTQGVR